MKWYILPLMISMLGMTGCFSTKQVAPKLAETEVQAKRNSDVAIAALERNMSIIASRMDDVQDKGLRSRNTSYVAARQTNGEIAYTPDGSVVLEKHESELTWNSAHEAAAASLLTLQHGKRSVVNENTNQKYLSNGLDGLDLRVENLSGATQSPVMADIIRARVGEKEVVGAAAVALLAAKYDGVTQIGETAVEIITAGGKVAGEIISLSTPAGQVANLGKEAVKVYVETQDGDVQSTTVEPNE